MIESIPHDQQRYETVGDWYYEQLADGPCLVIRVSEMQDPRHIILVAFHELWEATLCQHRGITQQMVDKFDNEFEARRQPGNIDEPGDDPQAPYRREHCSATGVERLLASELDVAWNPYANEVESL